MQKHITRRRILDRAPTRYPKGVVTVLLKIVDLVSVDNWKTDHIENFYSKPKSLLQLGFLTNLERHTVKKALICLLHDHVLTQNPHADGSYKVNTEVIDSMESNYWNSHAKHLAQKILNAVRMRYTRNPAAVFPWREVHSQCLCVRPFCSHPAII
jgi:hypothetical protein